MKQFYSPLFLDENETEDLAVVYTEEAAKKKMEEMNLKDDFRTWVNANVDPAAFIEAYEDDGELDTFLEELSEEFYEENFNNYFKEVMVVE